jgi:hypothetical protein
MYNPTIQIQVLMDVDTVSYYLKNISKKSHLPPLLKWLHIVCILSDQHDFNNIM